MLHRLLFSVFHLLALSKALVFGGTNRTWKNSHFNYDFSLFQFPTPRDEIIPQTQDNIQVRLRPK